VLPFLSPLEECSISIALHPSRARKTEQTAYLIVAASGHRVLEPLVECILALLELIDLLL